MNLNQLDFASIAPISDTIASTSSELRSEDLITLLKWIVASSSPVEEKQVEPSGEATEVEVLEDIRAQLVKLNENFKVGN